MAKRLYAVLVTCEIYMPVLAETPEEAEDIALANYHDEPAWDDDVSAFAGEPVTSLPHEFRNSIPWGAENDETCEDVLAEGSR
jgi:hypothetical protein